MNARVLERGVGIWSAGMERPGKEVCYLFADDMAMVGDSSEKLQKLVS